VILGDARSGKLPEHFTAFGRALRRAGLDVLPQRIPEADPPIDRQHPAQEMLADGGVAHRRIRREPQPVLDAGIPAAGRPAQPAGIEQ